MNTKAVAIVLVLMFALAIGAGAVAGKLVSRPPVPVATVDRGTLSDELQLDSAQRARMQHIWEDVRDTSRDCLGQAQRIQREQDDALVALLTDEQRAKYAKLTQDSKARVAALEGKRAAAVKDAVDRTRQILTGPQRKVYEQIIRDRIGLLPDAAADRSAPGLILQDTSPIAR